MIVCDTVDLGPQYLPVIVCDTVDLGTQYLPVIVCDTVDLVVYIDGEGYTVQTFVTDKAAKAARVVRLPHGL